MCFYLDIGSTVDLILTASLNKLSINRAHFKPAPVTLRMFEDPPFNVEDIVTLLVEHPVTGQKEECLFYVATVHKHPLLRFLTYLLFNLIKIKRNNICSIQSAPSRYPTSEDI